MPRTRKWELNLAGEPTMVLPSPPGYSTRIPEDEDRSRTKTAADSLIRQKKAMEVAWGQLKSFAPTALMLWLAGSTVNIFSILITIMAMWSPVKALLNVNSAFARFEDKQVTLLGAKALYLLFCLIALGGGLWKCHSLGLLPTHPSDWVAFLEHKQPVQISGGGVALV